MSRHLSSEQISRRVAGERNAPEEEHLRDCVACRAEVARLESVLTHFRSSVLAEVEQALPPASLDFRATSETSRRPHSPGRWVLVAATVLILVTVPLYQNARDRKRAIAQAEADTILLEQVDRAVSRTVPRPMEPLTELVRWGASPTEGSEKKR
jgi:predicted anti-sigma-YlaC factor YlaD